MWASPLIDVNPVLKNEIDHGRRAHPAPPPEEWYDKAITEYVRPGWYPVMAKLRGARVLEIGCGSGWLGLLAHRKAGAVVVATDIFKTAVHPELEFRCEDKENLPAEWAEVFDAVICSNVLHHGDLIKTCNEIVRVLKPSGLFFSNEEPLRPPGVSESEILKRDCAELVARGVREHRPSLEEYGSALKVFDQVDIYDNKRWPFWPGRQTHSITIIAYKKV